MNYLLFIYSQTNLFIVKFSISTNSKYYLRSNLLMNNSLFSDRKSNVILIRNEYFHSEKVLFSLVISTYERTSCFQRVFNHLMLNRPQKTEIIISDDASHSIGKINLLKNISNKYKNDEIYIITHTRSFGAFHTKLDGFLFSVGEFIMSLDDDDFFDNNYYIELATKTHEAILHNKNYNFIISLDFPYIKRWVKLPISIEEMISSFHNHVSFAFRRSLLIDVRYPPQNITIIRDDAPLMIPLYIQTKNDQILYYNNTNRYLVDRKCRSPHQSNQYKARWTETLNGFYFLSKFIININRTDIEPKLKALYGINKRSSK